MSGKKMLSLVRAFAVVLLALSLASCVSSGGAGGKEKYCSRNLSEEGVKGEKQLVNFFMANKPDADKKHKRAPG